MAMPQKQTKMEEATSAKTENTMMLVRLMSVFKIPCYLQVRRAEREGGSDYPGQHWLIH